MWTCECIYYVYLCKIMYISLLEVRTNTACEFGKENFCWKCFVLNPIGNLASSWPDCWPDCWRVLKKKLRFASALNPAKNPVGLWRGTGGHQLWPPVFFSFYTVLAPKYLHLFLSSAVHLERRKKTLHFLVSIFAWILNFNRWIFKPLRTSVS